MTADEMGERRCWLVERTFGDEDLVTFVYATTDGEYKHHRQRATSQLFHNPATAAIDVEEAELTPVDDEDERERYAKEAERMKEEKDPNEQV